MCGCRLHALGEVFPWGPFVFHFFCGSILLGLALGILTVRMWGKHYLCVSWSHAVHRLCTACGPHKFWLVWHMQCSEGIADFRVLCTQRTLPALGTVPSAYCHHTLCALHSASCSYPTHKHTNTKRLQ